jgi:hypothetical protein
VGPVVAAEVAPGVAAALLPVVPLVAVVPAVVVVAGVVVNSAVPVIGDVVVVAAGGEVASEVGRVPGASTTISMVPVHPACAPPPPAASAAQRTRYVPGRSYRR